MELQENQIVRLKNEVEGINIEPGAVGFIVKLSNGPEALEGVINREDRKRIRSYGDIALAQMMAIDEWGMIKGAGIFPASNLEPEDDDEWKDAKGEYDRRFGVAEAAQTNFKNQMITQIAQELQVPPELVGDVIRLYDKKQQEATEHLR